MSMSVTEPRRSASTPRPTITPEMLEQRWANLSPQSTATLRLIAIPISQGYKRTELAKQPEISLVCVRRLLETLESELRRIANEPT